MTGLMIKFLKNPITSWLNWYFKTIGIKCKNRDKKLYIGNLCRFQNTSFGKYNTFYQNVKINNTTIDDFVYVSDNTLINNARIGKFCSIGPNVLIAPGKHPTHYISTFPAFFSAKNQCQISFCKQSSFLETENVTIGNDVWIGANAIVLDGSTIGDGAIIAAGSVVTKDVPPYAIVGGVPAQIIRYRFNQKTIDSLLRLSWWNNDIEWIKTNSNYFNSPNEFLNHFGK